MKINIKINTNKNITILKKYNNIKKIFNFLHKIAVYQIFMILLTQFSGVRHQSNTFNFGQHHSDPPAGNPFHNYSHLIHLNLIPQKNDKEGASDVVV